ncbi:D-glycero-D-manno-heptose 1,7-bisphosphate phosphatase [Marivirga sericea]|uniref:D,D-heptose 1,7-bisphosphate phosphatase n=1 Tax=Marivirga sericea TaxID=1028 RepID=A0A1X7JWI0_9BACT|nr:HAD family hydrolase [Marivirga sericea]SMG32797.1 D-glycero-D-manno-heptose 1,7-bisphosphate phosphatase [Marivirga sericea]
MSLHKCIFLDRDGVLNKERGEYTFKLNDFLVLDGVKQSLEILKKHGYLLIVVTNQAGIAKGIYSKEDVLSCHALLQAKVGDLIDDIYFCPHHPVTTESLLRKPDSLMLEKAIAKWNLDISESFMIGDSIRDIEAAKKIGVKGILIGEKEKGELTAPRADSLLDAVHNYIIT